jgi:hypothetical protein
MLEREPRGDLLESRDRGGVALRQEAQRPDRRQESLAGRQREQHPEIAVATHPVEPGKTGLQLAGVRRPDESRGRRSPTRRPRRAPRRSPSRTPPRRPSATAARTRARAGRALRRSRPPTAFTVSSRACETRDLTANRLELLLARRGRVLGRHSRRQGEQQRQREERGEPRLIDLRRSPERGGASDQTPAVELRRRRHAVEREQGRHDVGHVGLLRQIEAAVREQNAVHQRRIDRAVVGAPDVEIGLDDRLGDDAERILPADSVAGGVRGEKVRNERRIVGAVGLVTGEDVGHRMLAVLRIDVLRELGADLGGEGVVLGTRD